MYVLPVYSLGVWLHRYERWRKTVVVLSRSQELINPGVPSRKSSSWVQRKLSSGRPHARPYQISQGMWTLEKRRITSSVKCKQFWWAGKHSAKLETPPSSRWTPILSNRGVYQYEIVRRGLIVAIWAYKKVKSVVFSSLRATMGFCTTSFVILSSPIKIYSPTSTSVNHFHPRFVSILTCLTTLRSLSQKDEHKQKTASQEVGCFTGLGHRFLYGLPKYKAPRLKTPNTPAVSVLSTNCNPFVHPLPATKAIMPLLAEDLSHPSTQLPVRSLQQPSGLGKWGWWC